MAKVVSFFLLALIAISMVATTALAADAQYHLDRKCCKTCLCVPPGFYGNKGVCPCYNNWKTKEGGPKCP
uniref:Gip1 n=1 Tax=Solanum tuberosum TaxID=4113 RepID=M1BQ26_SOLTU